MQRLTKFKTYFIMKAKWTIKNKLQNILFFSQKKVFCERNSIIYYESFHMLAGVWYVCFSFVIFLDIIIILNISAQKKQPQRYQAVLSLFRIWLRRVPPFPDSCFLLTIKKLKGILFHFIHAFYHSVHSCDSFTSL